MKKTRYLYSKYFWDLNEKALRETGKILKNSAHPKFKTRMVTLLSRCQSAKELFSLVSKKEFVNLWPEIRSYWKKIARDSEFRDWWETVYEQLLEEYAQKYRKVKGKPASLFYKIGRTIREARIQKGMTQKDLALKTGMKQPDISKIEEGKKNITLKVLNRLCEVLDIRRIDLSD